MLFERRSARPDGQGFYLDPRLSCRIFIYIRGYVEPSTQLIFLANNSLDFTISDEKGCVFRTLGGFISFKRLILCFKRIVANYFF